MTTTLANQLARINLATSGSMQRAQVVTLEIGAQDRFLGSRKSPTHSPNSANTNFPDFWFWADYGLHGSNPIHGEARDDLGKLEECKVRFADKPEIDPSVQVIGLRMNCGSSTFGWFADQT